MPIAGDVLKRRRLILGFSQADLAIVSGLCESTIGRIERDQAPNGGGNLSIDTVSRLCIALQMDLTELILPPSGNRYEKAVRFAHTEQSPAAAPELHTRSRSIKTQGLRKLTGARTPYDEIILARREENEEDLVRETMLPDAPERAMDDGWQFSDQSTE